MFYDCLHQTLSLGPGNATGEHIRLGKISVHFGHGNKLVKSAPAESKIHLGLAEVVYQAQKNMTSTARTERLSIGSFLAERTHR